MLRSQGLPGPAGWALAAFVPLQAVVMLFFLDLYGHLHLSVAGLEALLLFWAATAATPQVGGLRAAGVLLGSAAIALLLGVDLRVDLWFYSGYEEPETIVLTAGIFFGSLAALCGAAAQTAVRTGSEEVRFAAVIVALLPIAADLWTTSKLLDSFGQMPASVPLALLLPIASAAWLIYAIGELRRSAHPHPGGPEAAAGSVDGSAAVDPDTV